MIRWTTSLSVLVIGLGMMCAAIAGCDQKAAPDSGAAQKEEMRFTEVNQQRMLKAVPPPKLDTSLERTQLKRRLERFNQESKVSYIYLINYGKIMAFYTIKGKVSSVNSLLTTPNQIIENSGGAGSSRWGWGVVIDSPDLDGSYGDNGDAIFFFTTDDTYVEWNGEYMLCDRPLRMTDKPMLVMQVDGEGG